jgi:MGT family glycosyltransferase
LAKALFLSLPLHGHVNPSIPLVRELVDRGDAVTYYTAEAFASRIEQTGAKYRPYHNAFLAGITNLPERMDQLAWLLMRTTAEVLDDELTDFRREEPDYVICDASAPWGKCVAELLGVPVVTSVATFAFNRHVMAFGVSHGVRPKSLRILLSKVRHMAKAIAVRRNIRRVHRISGPGLMELTFGRSDMTIVYTSRQFQPCQGTFDERFQFVGPSIAPRPESVTFPWDQVRHPTIVYVSLGTLFNTDASFYRTCFAALREEDCQVVLSTGSEVRVEDIGPPPLNFVVQPYVPQLEVLRRAAAFVTHGGMNSVSESLGLGVPVVVIPQMSEQEIVGRRAEQLGAGLVLPRTDMAVESLRAAVRRVLSDGSYRHQAAQVGEGFRASGGVGRAADAIWAFTR